MYMLKFFGIGHDAKVDLAQLNRFAAFLAQAVAHDQFNPRKFILGAGDDHW
ncbi:hypothetical protein D3C73_1481310 [compost metagenome]